MNDPHRSREDRGAHMADERARLKWVAKLAGGYLLAAVIATLMVADQAGAGSQPSWASYTYRANRAGWANLVDWHGGLLIALVWLTFLLGSVLILLLIDTSLPLPHALGVRLGVGLIFGLLAVPVAAMWLSSLSVGHAGITVIVWLATVTAGCGYLLVAFVFHDDVGEAGAGWAFGVVSLVLLAGFLAATAWVGEVSDWHSGVILAMWLGELSAVFTHVFTTSARIGGAQPHRLGRAALSSSLVPVGSFSLGVVATIWLGTASDWDLRIILAFWVVFSLATAILTMVLETLAADRREAAR